MSASNLPGIDAFKLPFDREARKLGGCRAVAVPNGCYGPGRQCPFVESGILSVVLIGERVCGENDNDLQ